MLTGYRLINTRISEQVFEYVYKDIFAERFNNHNMYAHEYEN